jgi:hypothetical protein
MSNDKLRTYREFLDKCPQHQRAVEVERFWLLEVEKTECETLQGTGARVSDMQLYLQRYKGVGLCEETVKALVGRRVADASNPPPQKAPETAVRGPSLGLVTTPQPAPVYVAPYTPPPPVYTPLPVPRAEATIQRYANRFVEGEGYRTFYGSSYGSCAQSCLADGNCRMMEFHKPDAKCNLYNHTQIDGSSSDADTGIKRAGLASAPTIYQPPTVQQWAPTIRRYTNTYVEGEGYRVVTSSSYAACERLCAGDSSCRMLEFHKPDAKCNLYNHTRTSGSATTADVGIKQ